MYTVTTSEVLSQAASIETLALWSEDKQASVRVAKQELLYQVAELRSKLGGVRGLSEAKRTYQDLLMQQERLPSGAGSQAKIADAIRDDALSTELSLHL